MKAGVMEVPHLAVVTKADMGQNAIRARADVKGALSLSREDGEEAVPVLLVSSNSGDGIDDLTAAIDDRSAAIGDSEGLLRHRQQAGLYWLEEVIREEFGKKGYDRVAASLDAGRSPFGQWRDILAEND
jgi:LAO/AO transport system kinase